MNSCLYHFNKEKLTMFFPKRGGLEDSDLRRCLPEPSEAVFVFKENNDGSGGHHAHLVRSKQDGVGTLPCCLLAGGDVLTHLLGRTLISWAIGRHMLHLTEEMLVIAKQPQKLLNEYQVPAAVVADMIRKAMVQIGEEGALFRGGYFCG